MLLNFLYSSTGNPSGLGAFPLFKVFIVSCTSSKEISLLRDARSSGDSVEILHFRKNVSITWGSKSVSEKYNLKKVKFFKTLVYLFRCDIFYAIVCVIKV